MNLILRLNRPAATALFKGRRSAITSERIRTAIATVLVRTVKKEKTRSVKITVMKASVNAGLAVTSKESNLPTGGFFNSRLSTCPKYGA